MWPCMNVVSALGTLKGMSEMAVLYAALRTRTVKTAIHKQVP